MTRLGNWAQVLGADWGQGGGDVTGMAGIGVTLWRCAWHRLTQGLEAEAEVTFSSSFPLPSAVSHTAGEEG